MKKILTLAALTLLVLIITTSANATIRRVGYFGTPIPNTDYTDLQSAHNAAATGDTILVFPGTWSATYSKSLITLGYGYFVDTSTLHTQANAGLQNITGNFSIHITLAAGSDDCLFEGLDGFFIQGDHSGSTISGITVRRCYGRVYLGNHNVYSNWQVAQCDLSRIDLNDGNGTDGETISNLAVSNCIIEGMSGNSTVATNNGQFTNDVFYAGAEFNNGTYLVKNNIFIRTRLNDVNCAYQNNVYNNETGFGTPSMSGTGNVAEDNFAMNHSVFVGFSTQGSYSNDARWTLQAGSPAIGAGEGGTDCGMFGGINPYRLSGIPPIPSFYRLTSANTTASTNPYTVTFSVRSNN